MRRGRNHGVVFTGRVGAKMRARRHGACRKVVKEAFKLLGGPLSGGKVWLQSDGETLPIVCRGQAGHYRRGTWIPG